MALQATCRQEINAATGLLPKNLPNPPTYRKTNPADRPILIYAVHSDAMPVYQVDTYANTVLGQSLSTVNGVGQVSIGGQQLPAVHVQVDPEALASRGLSFAQIVTALSAATLDAPKGKLEGPHQQFTLDTNDQLLDARQFRNVIVAYQNGAPVTVKDLGGVINSSVNPRSGAWFGSKQSELLLIYREAGANTVQVVDQVKALLPQLENSIPRAVHVDLLSDRSQTIRASVADVERTLILTIVLVVLIIFAFLRKPWATAIPSVTVPLSIVATFGAMYLLGYSIDNLSLMGLTIAVGFVVDDAIVMIENIVRYIEVGDSAFEAALKGAGQIGFTIISITFSLIAVFIPLLFMSGIVGRLFHEFAMTVSISVVASAFIALTLTPMMCSLFLARESISPPGRISRAFEAFFDRMVAGYDRGLNWVFRHQLPNAHEHDRADRPDRISLRRDPEGLLPRTRHRFFVRPARSQRGQFLRRHCQNGKSGFTDHSAGSRRFRPRRVCRRHRRQFERGHRAHVHPAQGFQRAAVDRAGHGAAAAQSGESDRRQILHAAWAGRDHRRPA